MEDNNRKYHPLGILILHENLVSESLDSDYSFGQAKHRESMLQMGTWRSRPKSEIRTCFGKSGRRDPEQRLYRCILSYETMELICSCEQLEPYLLRHNWLPAFAGPGWVEYHYHRFEKGHKILKRIRVPELMEDASKKEILKLVRGVNRIADENILCAWAHREPLTSTKVQRSASSPASCSQDDSSSSSTISAPASESEA